MLKTEPYLSWYSNIFVFFESCRLTLKLLLVRPWLRPEARQGWKKRPSKNLDLTIKHGDLTYSGYSGCGSVWKWAIAPIDHFNEMGEDDEPLEWAIDKDWVEAGWSFCHWFWPDIQCGGWNNRVKPWKVVLLRKRSPLARNQKSPFFLLNPNKSVALWLFNIAMENHHAINS